MRTRLIVGFAFAALGASMFACTTAANPFAEVGEYCTAYGKAVCQASSFCEFDPTACQAYQTGLCNQQATQAQASGTRQYNPANVQPCLDKLNAAYGGNTPSVSAAALASIDSTCSHVFVGTATEGSSCTSDDDCVAADEICATAPNQPAQCAKPSPKDLNAACADPGDQCPSDAYCAATTSKCTPAQITGQTCDDSTPCVTADHCLGAICQVLGGVGQDCNTSADCDPSLFCDTYTSATAPTPVCVNGLTFARSSVDCLGIEGQSTGGTAPTSDAGTVGDAPSGD
jgi:hypothetical protein